MGKAFRRFAVCTAAVLATLAIAVGPASAATNGVTPAVASCASDGPFPDQAGNDAFVPTITNFGSDNCQLGPGNNSLAVLTLQNTLNSCYGQNLVRDSDYGPKTEAAVRHAQQVEHITADGLYGPQTRDHLRWLDTFGACSRLK